MNAKAGATIEDLYRVPDKGKAEIVNGEFILTPPAEGIPFLTRPRPISSIYCPARTASTRATTSGRKSISRR